MVKLSEEEQEQAEDISSLLMERSIDQDSDLTGVMKILNEDEVKDNLPSIDMKTRLHPFEIVSIVIHDTIIALNCLPQKCMITTRTKKRLAVSSDGKGREEMVRIVSGTMEQKQRGFFGRLFNKQNDQ